jgi:plastocyanin
MKKVFTLGASFATVALCAQSIATQGFSFNPSLLTVEAGAAIALTIGGGHTFTEVTQATWNANGNASNGGFNYSSGSHELVLSTPGTYYYVCQPHASMGMKGRIVVEASTSVPDQGSAPTMRLSPNPVTNALEVSGGLVGLHLSLTDELGRPVLERTIQGGSVDVSHLPAGRFIAVVRNQSGAALLRQRVIIAR